MVLRCRPFSEKEKVAGHSNIVTIDKAAATVSIVDPRTPHDPLPKTFTFDSVFDWTSTQQEVYNKTARPIVESVLAGYNGTVFAYGQTGTGKVRCSQKHHMPLRRPYSPTDRMSRLSPWKGFATFLNYGESSLMRLNTSSPRSRWRIKQRSFSYALHISKYITRIYVIFSIRKLGS